MPTCPRAPTNGSPSIGGSESGRNRVKRFLTLTLCSALLLSCLLTGCNNPPAEPADSTRTETTAEETNTERTPAVTEEDTMEDMTIQEIETTNNEPRPEVGITRSISSVTITAVCERALTSPEDRLPPVLSTVLLHHKRSRRQKQQSFGRTRLP